MEGGLFRLHWLYLENEVWLDSDARWIAVVDDTSRYAMVERFHHVGNTEYPGKASVIFYKNGVALRFDEHGRPILRSASPQEAPYYMEAELNSPIVDLAPRAAYEMDTEWFPARAGKELTTVTSAGVIERPLVATATSKGIELSGTFAVFFPGILVAQVLDTRGAEISVVELLEVDPRTAVELNQTINIPERSASIAIRLRDEHGMDRGVLSEGKIAEQKSN